MDAEYKFDLMLEKFWAKGLIEDTSNKAQKVFYFNMIKKEFKEWLIETKECSEDNFYDKITEDNYLQFRKWQIAKTEADTKKLEIVIELCGKNNSLSKVIQVDHINPALNKYKLAPLEAIDLIEDIGKKAYSPSFYSKVASAIIEHLERIMARPKINTNTDEVKKKNHQEEIWFKVGLLFASGEIYRIHKENNKEFRKTAKAIGNVNLRQIISNTLNHDASQYGKKNSRNIFLSMEKMTVIINHCKENRITIDERFMANYNTLQSKS
jgi:hypothetical protein